MPQVVFPEFRDSTKSINYPFIDTATLTDKDDTIVLPKDLFIDANIYLPGSVGELYISTIIVNNVKTTVTISDTDSDLTCYGYIESIPDTQSGDYPIALYTSMYKVGVLLLDKSKVSYFKSIKSGTYKFTELATTFVPSCVTKMPTLGITSIAINNRAIGNTLYGDIWLIGHNGIILRTQTGVADSIRIDVVGDPMYKQAAYPNTTYSIATPVQTINGMSPDEYGNFNITTTTSKDALRINSSSTGIHIYIAGANGD